MTNEKEKKGNNKTRQMEKNKRDNSEIRKEIFKNLEKTKKGLPISKRFKDYWTKGFQLHPCYREDWDEISHIFDLYSIDLSHQGPVITKQTLAEVKLAERITKQLMNDKKIRNMAKKVSYPLRNVYPNPKIPEEQLIEGTIFIVVFRLIPSFCLRVGETVLQDFISNGMKYDVLETLFTQHGTIRETQKSFEKSVINMIKKLQTKD